MCVCQAPLNFQGSIKPLQIHIYSGLARAVSDFDTTKETFLQGGACPGLPFASFRSLAASRWHCTGKSHHVQGQWRRLAEHLKAFRSWSDPDDFMSNAAFFVLALTKLRQYTVASQELNKLGDLDAPEHTEQSTSGIIISRDKLSQSVCF